MQIGEGSSRARAQFFWGGPCSPPDGSIVDDGVRLIRLKEVAYLSAVHEIEEEAVLLPVDAVDLPGQLILSTTLMLLIHCLLHLKVHNRDQIVSMLTKRGSHLRIKEVRSDENIYVRFLCVVGLNEVFKHQMNIRL